MEAKEIRIGVWLMWKDNGQCFDVGDLLLRQYHFWNHIDHGDIQPIQLTPKILKKCGFENIGRYYFGDNGYEIFKNGKVELMQPKKNDPFILAVYETKILFIHQLQNLYFALTGEELSINLP